MSQATENKAQKQALINKYRPIGIPAVKAASSHCAKKSEAVKTPCKNAGLPKFAEIS